MTLLRSTVRLLTLLISCALPAVASAQPWREAFQAGEYAKVANLLHEIVSEPEHMLHGDPDALHLLAHLYREGLGVPRDPLAACSLAQDAELAAQMAPPARPMLTMQDYQAYEAGQKAAHDFSAAVCGALSGPDFLAASRSRAGCYGIGMPEETITVGNQSVRLSRSGIVLAGTPDRDMGGLFMCPLAIALVRIRTVDVPENAPPSIAPRHFVEVFAWRRNDLATRSEGTYELSWQMFVIRGKEMLPMIQEMSLAASPSIAQGLPPGIDARVTLQMVRSGHVLWRIEGAPPKRGWLMLPAPKEAR
jgi:hypothetical protein